MKTTSEYIGEFEELVLLAILKLGSDAYGAAIIAALEDAGRSTSIGALYTTLSRLEEKGLVSSRLADPTSQRGGRAKKYFKIQASGERALHEASQARRKLSANPGFAFGGGHD
jgi:PadR family transcriptional regulator PadR